MLIFTAALAADCPGPAAQNELVHGLEAAERRLTDLDEDGFRAEVVRLSSTIVPCLSSGIQPTVAARYHRALAVHLFSLDQREGAVEAVEAARRLQPAFVWSDDLLAPDHPLRVAFDAASPSPRNRKVPEPRAGYLAFDGNAGRLRPRGVPTVSQYLDASGQPVWTRVLDPQEPLPPYRQVERRRHALLGCSIAGVAVGAGLLTAAQTQKSTLRKRALDPRRDAAALDRTRGLANVLQAAGFVGLGVGVGCGGAAVWDVLE